MEMNISINCGQSVGPLHHFWQSTGFTPANLLLNADMQQAMAYVGSIPHRGVTWVRIHYLLELVTAEGLGTDDPTYDWSRLDTALDALVTHGLKPFFELMGNVEGHFDDYLDEAQAQAWRRLIHDLALHLLDRYGADEIRSWLFETWNEPDVHFWQQSVEAFLAYYDACCAGLHDADPALRIGGPGTCRDLSPTLVAFLAHVDGGINALTGEPATRPAFLSWHVKGVRSHPEDLTPDTLHIVAREAEIVHYIRAHHPALADLPMANNECDPQVGWGTIHTWRARPYYAALAAKILLQHQRVLIDEMGVDYALLSNDNGFLGTWGHRTMLTRFGEFDHIDHGQGAGMRDAPRLEEDPRRRRFALVKKPIFNLMTLLSLLGDESCAVSGGEGSEDALSVLATRRGDAQVAVLIVNSRDKITAEGMTRLSVTIEGLPFTQGSLAYYRIDETTDDPFAVWERQNAPHLPTPDQLAEIRSRQELSTRSQPHDVTIQEGALTINYDQPLPGVTLILVSRRSEREPPQVQNVRLERYAGISDQEEVMVLWDGIPSRTLRTYEVYFAPHVDGPYTRVNPQDQLDTAFLHVREPGPGVYTVRAVDYWERHGEFSERVGG
jgi:L-iduronidase